MADDEGEHKDSNEASKPEQRAMCWIHPEEEIRLFCSKCEDAVCFRCLLEIHQQHPVRDIAEVFYQIKEKVNEWCSQRDATFSSIEQRKQEFDNVVDEYKEAETVALSDLQSYAVKLRTQLDQEVDRLSNELKDAFKEKEHILGTWIKKVSICKTDFDHLNPESKPNVLQLYSSLKRCLSEEFLADLRKLRQPKIQLNKEMHISLGYVDPRNAIENRTQELSEHKVEDTSGNINKSFPYRISSKNLFYGRVTKIVPINEDEAWIIYGRKLYHFEQSKILASAYEENVDDVVVLKNGDLFVLNQESTFIFQVNKAGVVTPFTCTDPYLPICMDYVEKSCSLMVWMSEKETRHLTLFGLNGTKKNSIGLPASYKGDCFMAALSCNDFSIVFTVEQTTGLRNYIHSYVKDSRTYKSFGGTFGCNPYLQFVCEGMCYDNEGCLIVSDKQFKTVYKLDKNLQFVKTLLDRRFGLVSPSALAWKDGLLWVADYDNITVYKYSDIA